MSMHKSTRPWAQRGAAAIEFGLLMMPMAFITLGTTELGRAFHSFNSVAKCVRDGARYQSTVAAGNTLGGRCLTLTGSPTNNGTTCSVATPLLPGMTLAMVTVCDRLSCAGTHNQVAFPSAGGTGGGVVNLVTVTITGYPFVSMAPFFVSGFNFGAIHATMVQPI